MIQPRIEGRVELAAADDQAGVLCELLTGAQHRVRIFSDTLDPALFDNAELAHELTAAYSSFPTTTTRPVS